MKKEQYIRRVLRGIKVTDKVKKRIKDDLQTEFENKGETGLTVDEIISQKGTPKEVAGEFNQAYSDTKMQRQYRVQKSLRIAVIILISLSVVILISSFFIAKSVRVGVIGGMEGVSGIVLTPPSLGLLLLDIAGLVFLVLGCTMMIAYFVKRKLDSRSL